MRNFYFSLENDPKGGQLHDFFQCFAAQNPTILLMFPLMASSVQVDKVGDINWVTCRYVCRAVIRGCL